VNKRTAARPKAATRKPTSKPGPSKGRAPKDAPPKPARLSVKIAAFVTLVAVCAIVGLAFFLHARSENPKNGTPQENSVVVAPSQLDALMSAPHLLFQNTDLGHAYGKVEVVPLSDPGGPRAITPLTCDRVAAAQNVGVCLIIDRGILTTYKGEIFDRNFHVMHTFSLPGLPSRARLSPNGHWAAMTVFVNGDNYSQAGFSTRTSLVDTSTGKNIGNLEQFDVTDNGKKVTAVNRNYWGVTFADDNDTFYATLGIANKIKLITGSISSRSAHTIRGGIECPSLSPDQTRIAYKSRVGGTLSAVTWRLHVVNLKTGGDIALAETRSVDDQVEWLDNHTVLYSILRSPTGTAVKDTYSVPADGTGQPSVFVKGAWSPAVGG
jgi:hypothetical protein